MRHHPLAPILTIAALALAPACTDDTGSSTPNPVPGNNGTPDMNVEPDIAPEPDLSEPDMAEPDMAEPDMAEPDLGPMDEAVTGTWTMNDYTGMAIGDEIITFELMNPEGSTQVMGTYTLPDAGGTGPVGGTYLSMELELQWEQPGSAAMHQFLGGAPDSGELTGRYLDPGLGGISQDVILQRVSE